MQTRSLSEPLGNLLPPRFLVIPGGGPARDRGVAGKWNIVAHHLEPLLNRGTGLEIGPAPHRLLVGAMLQHDARRFPDLGFGQTGDVHAG